MSKNRAPQRARPESTSTKSHREECQAERINWSRYPPCDGISARSGGAMSVGVLPFLTVSERPSAMPDKSGALQKIRTDLHRSKNSSLEFSLDQGTILA